MFCKGTQRLPHLAGITKAVEMMLVCSYSSLIFLSVDLVHNTLFKLIVMILSPRFPISVVHVQILSLHVQVIGFILKSI